MSFVAMDALNQSSSPSSITLESLREAIRTIPDYPKPGIQFKDITTLVRQGPLFSFALEALAEKAKAVNPTVIAGIEARGFIFGAPLAERLGLGFVPIRKQGKLPGPVIRQSYQLEYGEDRIELHEGSVSSGDRVLIVDDLLATGGTADASFKLFEQADATVCGFLFLVELSFLQGRDKLTQAPVDSLLTY